MGHGGLICSGALLLLRLQRMGSLRVLARRGRRPRGLGGGLSGGLSFLLRRLLLARRRSLLLLLLLLGARWGGLALLLRAREGKGLRTRHSQATGRVRLRTGSALVLVLVLLLLLRRWSRDAPNALLSRWVLLGCLLLL